MFTLIGIIVVHSLVCAIIAVRGFFSSQRVQQAELNNRFARLSCRTRLYIQRIRGAQSVAQLFVNSMTKKETRALYELQLLSEALESALADCQQAAKEMDFFAFEQLMNEFEAGEFVSSAPGVVVQPCGAWEPHIDQLLTGVEGKASRAQAELNRLRREVLAA